MFDLTGLNALVTGASGGIGGAIASALHGAGARVAISGTRREALEELAAQLGGERVDIIEANLSERADTDRLAETAEKQLGQIDILVNNAGITRDGLFMRMSDADWDAVIEMNLTSGFRLTRAVLRGMVKRRFGRIIGISSVVGVTGNAGQANYAAAKAGLIGMTKSLAFEVATRGVTANAVAPGFIDTPMTHALNEKQREFAVGKIPMGRFGAVDEIAAACLYLASREAGYVTGHTLHVNGGITMV